jgi:hypothetical protein
VAVEKGTKGVISGALAQFLERIFNHLRTDFRAISAQEEFFNSHITLSTTRARPRMDRMPMIEARKCEARRGRWAASWSSPARPREMNVGGVE